jgi:hypothetical protein
MADAADSKSAEGNLVRVRLSPRASCDPKLRLHILGAQPGFYRRLYAIVPLGSGVTYERPQEDHMRAFLWATVLVIWAAILINRL